MVARVLQLNKIQESNLKLAFLYARKRKMPLRDLVDLQGVLERLSKKKKGPQG